MKGGYTYILTNKSRSVFYIGVTADLTKRMIAHRNGTGSIFCRRYHVSILVYYEFHQSIQEAIHREKQLKKWNREWKLELIRKKNPLLKDLRSPHA